MEVSLDLAALVGAVVWPLVVLFVVARYREPISKLAQSALDRGFNLGLPGGFSLEFTGAEELAPRWSGTNTEIDLRRPIPGAQVNDSTARAFTEQLRESTPADYAVVDLGTGLEWLTSRLYIMAILLRRMRNLEVFVFVETAAEVRRRFVGVASLARVRWALAQQDPYLEDAFARAYAKLSQDSVAFDIVSRSGRIEIRNQPGNPDPALFLLRNFLELIQAPQAQDPGEWVALVGSQESDAKYEHARWLDAASVEALLGPEDLITSYVVSSDLHARNQTEQLRLIVEQPPRYVAATRNDRRFERLIDQAPIVRQLSMAALRRGNGRRQ